MQCVSRCATPRFPVGSTSPRRVERARCRVREHGAEMAAEDDVDALRTERDEWRRRAEVAEAIAAERLARAETAETALRAAEAALARQAVRPEGAAPAQPGTPTAADQAAEPKRPASLRERWRRYTETIE
jgi:hypothetical protein